MIRLGVLTLVPALLVSGCGGGSLAESDPNGYEACSLLSESIQSGDVAVTLSKSMDAGKAAARSSTESIREASRPVFEGEAGEALEGTEGASLVMADAEALTAACEDEGFDMPAADEE